MELEFKRLTKTFGDTMAVNHVNLTLTNGVYGLLGINGAGKTTLIKMICTLLQPTTGTINCNGKSISDLGEKYRNILGYLPQEIGFYPDFKVSEYLFYIAELKGINPKVSKKRVEAVTAEVGLTKARKQKIKTLSGGMKRRVGIAQALLNQPHILVLDEPTVGLDPNERIRFRNLVSEIAENRLVILSTHIVSDIEYTANKILMMKSGSIIESGTSEEIIHGMSEKVWEGYIGKESVPGMMKHYKISNMKSEGDGIYIRIISTNQPFEQAKPVTPSLEDAFLYYFGEREGDVDVAF
ncbi:MAG: ABC transporter ATP-binding protein [Eubacterium sp.]